MSLFEPVVLFFVLGVVAGLARSDLKFPQALYEGLSIYLLLAIGLKGGVELAKHDLASLVGPSLAVIAMGAALPLLAYPILRFAGGLARADAASIAAHYGSVSVVTFAVASAYLARQGVPFEGYVTVLLVLLEMPALVVGVMLARRGQSAAWGEMLKEVLSGKSIVLLAGGLAIGWIAGPDAIEPLDRLFFDLFKGVLALFLLEMGLVAAGRVAELKRFGPFLVVFAIVTPMVFAAIGAALGTLLGLSPGGATLLAVLAASASYIAAPAAMRVAVPEANPALSIGAALGITFPFNIIAGIPLYHWVAGAMRGVW